MANNSDIIKIGFDYRASLEQFKNETNGVFDGISEKAGKQKITIHLDAKNDKVIEKIKELQKLKLDKFTFEFGDSGIKEQLKTFGQLENKINEIINLSKGLSNFIDKTDFSTKNKTEAYNQLKQMAEVFKNFYGNEEAIHTKAGTDAAYAYYKAYEEALRKSVAESKLQKATVDVDKNDTFFIADKLVYDRINQYDNQLHYGSTSDLTEEIASLEQRLLKFSDAYSKVKANLGEAPITPEIMQNIEKYVHNLEIAEARAKNADLMGFTKEDIDSYKDIADMYLGFATGDAINENEKYLNSLKEIQQVAKETDKIIEDIGSDKSNISSDIKDAFQGDIKNTEDSSAAIKEESKALEQVSDSANEASAAKENFAKANKKVKESAEISSNAVKEEVENLKKFSNSELSGMEKDLAKFNASSDGFGIKPDDGHSFDTWKNQISDLNNKIEQYRKLVEKARANGGIVDKEDETQITNLKNEIEGLISTMSKVPQSKRGWNDDSARKLAEKINKALEDNSRLAKSAQDSLKAFYNELVSVNPTRPLNEIQNAYLEIIQQQRELGNTGRNWLDIFKDKKIYSFLGQAASMFSFYDLVNVGRKGFETIRELDTALTEMRKVSDEGIESLKRYQVTTFDVGDSVGATAKTIQNSTADWQRLGESIDEAAESAKVSNILLNVSEFDNINSATESLVSMSQAYQELDKIDIVDKLNNIGELIA